MARSEVAGTGNLGVLGARIKRASRYLAGHPAWDSRYDQGRIRAGRALLDSMAKLKQMEQPIPDEAFEPIPFLPYNPIKRDTIGTTRVTLEQIPDQPMTEGGVRVRLTAYVPELKYRENGGFPIERKSLTRTADGTLLEETIRFDGVSVNVGNQTLREGEQEVRPVIVETDHDTALAFADMHLRGLNSHGRRTRHLKMQLVAAGADIRVDSAEGWEQSVYIPAGLEGSLPHFSAKLRRDLGLAIERGTSPFTNEPELRLKADGNPKVVAEFFDGFTVIRGGTLMVFGRDGTVAQPGIPPSRLAQVA